MITVKNPSKANTVRISSLLGYTVVLAPGEEKSVPDVLKGECLAANLDLVGGNVDAEVVEPKKPARKTRAKAKAEPEQPENGEVVMDDAE